MYIYICIMAPSRPAISADGPRLVPLTVIIVLLIIIVNICIYIYTYIYI